MSFLAKLREENGDVPDPVTAPPAGSGTPTLGYQARVLEDELNNVRNAPEGTRNATLNQAAFNLGQLPINPDTWHAQLLQAATDNGLTRTEAEKTITSGIRGAARNPRPAHRLPSSGRPSGPVQDLPALDGYQETGPPVIDWDALWADDTETEWLCEPLLPAGRLVSLYSPPGVGKSLLALQVAVAISQGAEALGSPTKRTDVLYLDYENVDLDVRDRLQDMGHGPEGLHGLKYWLFPTIPPLDTLEGGQALLRAVQALSVGLVVIDTISRCIQGDENDSATILGLYRNTLMPLKAAGVAVLRLDHTGKDETKGQRGSSAKSGDADLIWRYSEVIPESTFLLQCEKNRIRIDEKTMNIQRTQTPTTHRVDTRTVGQAKRDAILRALDDAALPLSAGRDRARQVLAQAGIKIRDTTLAAILRERQGLPAVE